MKTDTPRTDEKDLHCESLCDQAWGAEGWLLARQLEQDLNAVTEQRDRLAEALRNCLPFITGEGCGEYSDAREALQSLTTNEP
jgi:hypothetical protein